MSKMFTVIGMIIAVLLAVTILPTIWDAIWVESVSTPMGSQVNGTTWTLLRLVPLLFVGLVVFGIMMMIKG